MIAGSDAFDVILKVAIATNLMDSDKTHKSPKFYSI